MREDKCLSKGKLKTKSKTLTEFTKNVEKFNIFMTWKLISDG